MASLLSLCLLLQATVTVFGYPSTDNINFYCDSTITVFDSVILKLKSYSWPNDDTCSVTLTASNFYHTNAYLSVQFLDIALPDGLSGDCPRSRVDVKDSYGTFLSSQSGVCGYTTPFDQPWTSTGDSVVVRLKRLQSGQTGSFRILVSQFANGVCDEYGEYECDNGRCVDSSVTCDGYDDCTDDSDETSGCTWGAGSIAGVAVAVTCTVLIFFGISFAVYRRRTYGTVFWRSPVMYGGQTVVQNNMALTPQYGVQNPAPVYTVSPPPYSAT
ncbi:uncharacterized protein LOC124266197 [Haliotis rubra]|uniref:uncharacterized protein LOC124266197 n=1 Tax=Haliotis rubra TaxID=36100 RepID=UPI001EE58809|nr:uncharacterized protein LOC124266197 [Haliotis rubra]XP_046556957.1 uncharacterized protein LOC124266197 [Haliotis rubra]XP_046556958.1 uncharacterized protein LOC124266197 [Haliotis rubra]